eukprot:3708477-Pleurochrysis_carterae.AAC.1
MMCLFLPGVEYETLRGSVSAPGVAADSPLCSAAALRRVVPARDWRYEYPSVDPVDAARSNTITILRDLRERFTAADLT